jgi:hypothetical protein
MTSGKHETRDLNPRYVVYFAVGLVVMGVFVFVLAKWMLYQFQREDARGGAPPAQVNVQTSVPEPRLQINPQGDLDELRRQEAEILTTYAWIDRDRGVARIPIDRAMQLFVERQKQ